MTLKQLSEACDIHWTYLGQVERGGRNVSLLMILAIAGGLSVAAGDLLAGLPPQVAAPGARAEIPC